MKFWRHSGEWVWCNTWNVRRRITTCKSWMPFFNSISMLPFILMTIYPFFHLCARVRFKVLFATDLHSYLMPEFKELFHLSLCLLCAFLCHFSISIAAAHGHWVCKLKMLLKHMSNPVHFFGAFINKNKNRNSCSDVTSLFSALHCWELERKKKPHRLDSNWVDGLSCFCFHFNFIKCYLCWPPLPRKHKMPKDDGQLNTIWSSTRFPTIFKDWIFIKRLLVWKQEKSL